MKLVTSHLKVGFFELSLNYIKSLSEYLNTAKR